MNKSFVRRDESSPKPKNKRKFKRSYIFVILMLLYPVLQFLIMWFGVNINSILLTFQKANKWTGVLEWVSFDDAFVNYKNIVMEFFESKETRQVYINSLAYFVLNCLITLPISLFFAYFIFKKIYAGGVFKTIFYLPSVLPIVALTIVYQFMFAKGGLLEPVFELFNVDCTAFFTNDAKWMVWIFCFWTGIGYDVMLLTSGMARIPRDLLESSKMDGVTPLKEFFHVIIPLTWPTITTLFIFGMMGVFGTFLQPMLLTGVNPETNTIGLQIFTEANNPAKNHPATMGLICTIIATPIVLGIRSFLNHFFKEVSF